MNEKPAKAGYKTKTGDIIVVQPIPVAAESSAAASAEIKPEIVFEDDWLAIINKPAGLLVHAAGESQQATLASVLSQVPFSPSIRLDIPSCHATLSFPPSHTNLSSTACHSQTSAV